MSTRYIWEKYLISEVLGMSETAAANYTVTSSDGRFCGSYNSKYEIVKYGGKAKFKTSEYQHLQVSGSVVFPVDTNEKLYLFPYDGYADMYADIMLKAPDTAGNYAWHLIRTDKVVSISRYNIDGPYEESNRKTFYICSPTLSQNKGELLGKVSSNDPSSYENNGIAGSYWYIYKGSDNIDPTAVTYSKSELQAGESVTIQAVPRAPTYGGTIYYQYQYSTDDGSSWTNLGSKTTSTSKTVTIPEGASQFKARVLASDNYGFTSTTYVTGPNMGVSILKAYIGIAEKAHSAAKIYIGVNGKARKVIKGYVGIDGKARIFL